MSLDCLQEEVVDSVRRDSRRGEYSSNMLAGLRTAVPLPLPPGRGGSRGGNQPEDQRGAEGSRGIPGDDRLGALRAYRRAKGLCHTCGEKWSREHKCAATVQLHVVEELWYMLEDHELNSQKEEESGSQGEAELLSISKEAAMGDENA